MNKKILGLLTLVFALSAPPIWAQQNFSNLTAAIGSFADNVAPALPAASASGLSWSDSWIGYLVGVPPHLGVGVTVAAVAIPTNGLKPLFDTFGVSLPSAVSSIGLPLPVYTANARVGGLILPFDVGFKLGLLPRMTFGDFGVDYLLAGGDVRYALLQDGVLPGVSIGLGVNYMKVNLGYTFSSIGSTTFNGGGGSITFGTPTATLSLDSLSYDLTAEISKNLLIITPYAGAALNYSNSTAGANFNSTITYGGGASATTFEQAFGGSFSGTGYSTSVAKNGVLSYRLFAGTSLNLFIFKIDLQALYNLPSGNLGLSLGTRFQL